MMQNIRFFCLGENDEGEADIVECDEAEFCAKVDEGAEIRYERHTVRENGVAQVCLTAWIGV